jgi:hypothetical protein
MLVIPAIKEAKIGGSWTEGCQGKKYETVSEKQTEV